MSSLSRKTVGLLAFLLPLFAISGAAWSQIRVMTSGGFAAPLKAALPQFEKESGITVTVSLGKSQGAGPETIAAQLKSGAAVDLVILSREGLNDLAADGRIAAGSDADLAKTPLGMAVKADAPKPDIATVAAFKDTLLRAKSITYPSSTTGIYMVTKLFPRLGIAQQVAAKSNNAGIASVAKGEAEIAIQPVSELLHVPGTAFVGILPQEVQYISIFSAGLVKSANHEDQARQLVRFLTSAKAADAIRDSGMEPIKAR